MHYKILFSVVLALLLFSVTAQAEDDDNEDLIEKTGVIKVVGTSNFQTVVLQVKDDTAAVTTEKTDKAESPKKKPQHRYRLTGAYVDELRQLRNITVCVRFLEDEDDDDDKDEKKGDKLGYEDLNVVDYEIMDVGNGRKPYFGTLAQQEGELFLVVKNIGQGLALHGNSKVIKVLRAGIGSRAWVVGELDGAKLSVQVFHVLTKAEPKTGKKSKPMNSNKPKEKAK